MFWELNGFSGQPFTWRTIRDENKKINELAVNEIETREASESHARTARFDNQLLFIYFTWRNNASIIQFPPEKKVHLSPLVFEFFKFSILPPNFEIISVNGTFKFDWN